MDQLSGPQTFCTEVAGASAGTTTTVTTARALAYCIKGKAYRKAAITNEAFPSTDHTTGAAFVAVAVSKGCILALGFNAAGSLIVAQGPSEDLDASDNFIKAPEFPALKDTFMPFAYVVCKNGASGSAWTPGTSNWTATALTDTFVDVLQLPDRLQVS